jgi:hypothetical protein
VTAFLDWPLIVTGCGMQLAGVGCSSQQGVGETGHNETGKPKRLSEVWRQSLPGIGFSAAAGEKEPISRVLGSLCFYLRFPCERT